MLIIFSELNLRESHRKFIPSLHNGGTIDRGERQ